MGGENDAPGGNSKAADLVKGHKPFEGNGLNQQAADLLVKRQPGNEIDEILRANGLTQSLASPDAKKVTVIDDIVSNNLLARLGLVTVEGAGYAVPGVMNAAIHDLTHPVEAMEKGGNALAIGLAMRVLLPKEGAAKAAAATAFTYFMARDAIVPIGKAWGDVWDGGDHATVNLAAQKMGDGLGMFGWDAYWGMKIAGAGERLGEKGMRGVLGDKGFNTFERTKGDFLGSDKYFAGRHLNRLGNAVDRTSAAFAERLIGKSGAKESSPLTFEEKMLKARQANTEHELAQALQTIHKHGVKTADGHDVGYSETVDIILAGMDPRKMTSDQLTKFKSLMAPSEVPKIVLPEVEALKPKVEAAKVEGTAKVETDIKGSTPALAAKVASELDPKNFTELAGMVKDEMGKVTDEQAQVLDVGENAVGAVHASLNPNHAALDPGYREWLNQMIALNKEVGGDPAKLQQVAPLFFKGRDAAIGQMSAGLDAVGANVHSMNLMSLEMYTGLKQRMNKAGINADKVLAAKNPPLNLVAGDKGAGPHTIPQIDGVWDVDLIHWPRNMQELRMLRGGTNAHEGTHNQYGGILRFADSIREQVIGETVSKALGAKATEMVDVPGQGQMSKKDLIVAILKAQANENTADIGGAAHTGPAGAMTLGILLQALRQDGKLETRNVFGKELANAENPLGIEVHANDVFRPKLVAEVLRQRAIASNPQNPDPMLMEYAKQLDAYAEAASNGGKDYVWASIDNPGQSIRIPRAELDAVITHLVHAQLNTPLKALEGHTYAEILPDLPTQMKKMDAIADLMVDAITNKKPLTSIPYNVNDYSMIQLQSAQVLAAARLAAKGMKGPEINSEVNRVSDHLELQYRKNGDPHVDPLLPKVTLGKLATSPSLLMSQTGKGVGHTVEALRTWENRDKFLIGYGSMAVGRHFFGTFQPGSASQALVQKGRDQAARATPGDDTASGAPPQPQTDSSGRIKDLPTDKVIIPPGVDGPAGQPRTIPKPFDPFLGRRSETTVDGQELRRLQREGQNWIDQQQKLDQPPPKR